jgi:hypothetical protein
MGGSLTVGCDSELRKQNLSHVSYGSCKGCALRVSGSEVVSICRTWARRLRVRKVKLS